MIDERVQNSDTVIWNKMNRIVSDDDSLADKLEYLDKELRQNFESQSDSNCITTTSKLDPIQHPATAAMNRAVSAMKQATSNNEDFFENNTYHEFARRKMIGTGKNQCLSRNSSLIDL